MIIRDLAAGLRESATQFPVVAVLGPRQSGKTTLVRSIFADYHYVSLEEITNREFAEKDPRQFLRRYVNETGVILDEVQQAPDLLSYMQTIVDEENRPGKFIITGSQNFLMTRAVTQSLAGRVAIMTLLPLSINELEGSSLLPATIDEAIFNGSYPRAYSGITPAYKLYASYIKSYIERDVRQIQNIANLSSFQRFVRLCAGRIGQLLNISSLANDASIDYKTARAWLSLLEASYIIFLLQPYYQDLGKRLIRSPKLYFFDTGIACSLLNMRSPDQLAQHYMRGHLVESYLIADFLKQYYNRELIPPLYHWRNKLGIEVDCIIDEVKAPLLIEIKSGETITSDYFKQVTYVSEMYGWPSSNNYVIYGGNEKQVRSNATVLPWKMAGNLIKTVIL